MASIQKDLKTGKWFCRVSYKDENDKYKTKTKKGFSTKKEATVYASQLELEADNGFQKTKEDIVLADYFDEWIETYKIGQVSVSTENKYLYTAKLLREHFDNKKLIDLTRQEYQEFLNERGKGNGKDIVEKTHYYLKSCLQLAMADGLIEKDPTYNAVIRYEKEYDNTVKAWSEKEAKILNKYLANNMNMKNLMLYIALNTGLRIGEIYGLNYSDFRKNTLYVNRGYDYVQSNDFTPGKNKGAIRAIVITPGQFDMVMRYKFRNQKRQSHYLFLDEFNNPLISHTGLLKHLYKLCAELGIKKHSIHALRHTHCSYLLYRKMDIHYISKRMGHSSTIETIKTYSHIIDEMKQQQDTLISDLLTEFDNKH